MGNDHDQVGRYLMVQGAPQTAGRFADEVRMYKAPPPEVSSEHFYETDPTKPYKRGWSHPDRGPAADHLVRARRRAGALGRDRCASTCATTCTGRPSVRCASCCPHAENRVTLAEETDRHGLPVARFDYTQCDNDKR